MTTLSVARLISLIEEGAASHLVRSRIWDGKIPKPELACEVRRREPRVWKGSQYPLENGELVPEAVQETATERGSRHNQGGGMRQRGHVTIRRGEMCRLS